MKRIVARLARKSRHPKSHHGALAIKGGNIVASAWNGKAHAEVAVLEKLPPYRRKGVIIWTARVMANGELGMAKPCDDCISMMKESGVKRVYYSIDSEKMECLTI